MARRAHAHTPATMQLVAALGLEIARGRRARRLTAAELAEVKQAVERLALPL